MVTVERVRLESALGRLISTLEGLSTQIYEGKPLNIKPGVDIRTMPEYTEAITALANLRHAASHAYRRQMKE